MKISFTWHHVDKSEIVEDLLRKKLEKLKRHADDIHNLHMSLEHQKQEFTIKATAHFHGKDIHAHSVNVDMYKAIDDVTHKFIRQVEETKEKMSR